MNRRCTAIKISGERCNGNATRGGTVCFWHSPDVSKRKAASAKGGNTPTKPPPKVLADGEPFKIETAQDITALLSDCIQAVKTGELDTKVANCVAYMSNIILKSIDNGTLEERIEALEELYAKKHTVP
ncbi:MAG: hypothetical protein KOO62_09195 [candidate division Zixibacteria bacterium]|nr:hypothetical protein [candidate division Zixibacteria bacterium]